MFMRDRYQETLQKQQKEQERLEETMRRHPDTQEHDNTLQAEFKWLNKQEK
jgi:hypothetical protein